MRVVIKRSTKMPTLYSYYLSSFGSAALEYLKESRPFSAYHKASQEYECTKDVAEYIEKYIERVHQRVDFTLENSPCLFERKSHGKYGYQEDAVRFSKQTDNIFVNFPQGMGKSLTSMKIIEANDFKKVLIICGQSNLQEEWLKDATKHGYVDKLQMQIIGNDTGASTTKKLEYLLTPKDKTTDLVNIEALRNTDIVFALNERKYDCIIVDEVQSAKGWKAEQTKGLHELIRTEGQVRIALSGTPVLNDPLEFFSMLKYFGLLKDTARTTFEKYYGEWGFDRWGHYICTGYKNFADLQELIAPVLCYVDKSELGLPPKTRKKVDLDWQVPDEFIYLEKVNKMTTARMKKEGFKSKPAVRAKMQFLSSTAKPKIDFIIDLAKESKVLVFSEYTTVLSSVKEQIEARGGTVLYYHGELSMKERLAVLEQWRQGKAPILLLSIMTARYGLNLTEATKTVFLEPPTSLAILEQAEDRAHRIGQTEPVQSYLLSASRLDEDDLDSIVRKQEALDDLWKFKENGTR